LSDERIIIEKMFKIPNKNGEDVDFVLNDEQVALDESLTGRDIIAKARQMGFSTYVLGLFLARCLMYRNRNAVLISHTTDATQKLLLRIQYMIKYMKGAQPVLKYASQNQIVFGKMDSSIRVGTAGSDDYGVGDTITDLHCSEVSRWSNPAPLLSGLFQAVPTNGTIIMESTGRGVGNYFHRAVMKANESGDEGFKLHFFGWLNRPEYQLPVEDIERDEILNHLNEDYEESRYVEKYGLTAEQIKWRRRKIAELDYDVQQFKEQYPVELDECFQATGGGFFPFIHYVMVDDWRQEDAWTWRLGDHPKVGSIYAAGVDPAGGVGLDNSVLEIFEVADAEGTMTGEQVLEFATRRMDPTRFAQYCVERFLKQFNCYVNFERNNHGFAFGAELLKIYDNALVHRTRRQLRLNARKGHEMQRLSDFGFMTTEMSKPLIVGKVRTRMREKALVLHSQKLQMECSSYVELENGKIEAAQGCLDDRIMATAMANEVFEKALGVGSVAIRRGRVRRGPTTAETFKAETLMDELVARYGSQGGCPVGDGLEVTL
jgi:hypothetical protein